MRPLHAHIPALANHDAMSWPWSNGSAPSCPLVLSGRVGRHLRPAVTQGVVRYAGLFTKPATTTANVSA